MAKELSEEVKAAIIIAAATLAGAPAAVAGLVPHSTESLFELYDQIVDRLVGAAERLDAMRVGADGDADEDPPEDADEDTLEDADGGAHEGADEDDGSAA